ncbi:hypothetical protein KQX54_007910 [Cotesia glomerata]|uniref:Uncharacterized protein n=1 Tax=Cotesia glomerata TaxID=32391 RepID=A0AAV7J3N4_COTGL|nr:hypothetical protein KQX54_007910 [Cotesia glomerata]
MDGVYYGTVVSPEPPEPPGCVSQHVTTVSSESGLPTHSCLRSLTQKQLCSGKFKSCVVCWNGSHLRHQGGRESSQCHKTDCRCIVRDDNGVKSQERIRPGYGVQRSALVIFYIRIFGVDSVGGTKTLYTATHWVFYLVYCYVNASRVTIETGTIEDSLWRFYGKTRYSRKSRRGVLSYYRNAAPRCPDLHRVMSRIKRDCGIGFEIRQFHPQHNEQRQGVSLGQHKTLFLFIIYN